MKGGFATKKRGFLLAEGLVGLALMSLVLAVSLKSFRGEGFKAQTADREFMNKLKAAITEQRVRAVKEPGIGYQFVLPGDGAVHFRRQTKTYRTLDEPDYRVYIQKGVHWQIITQRDFTSWTTAGTNGFTILVYKKDRLLAKLIFQVVTSSFREEYYGSEPKAQAAPQGAPPQGLHFRLASGAGLSYADGEPQPGPGAGVCRRAGQPRHGCLKGRADL